MTEFDRHYTNGTLRKSKPAEDYYPEKDWGWTLIGGIFAGVAAVYTVMWLLGY